MEGLDAWLHNRPNNCKLNIQHQIGWEAFFYGYIDAEWGHRQQRHIYKNKTQQTDSAYTWGMKLIQFLWQQSHVAWLQRNKDVHGNSIMAKDSTLLSCEARLKAVYSLKEEVPYYDKQIFSKTIEDMLKLPVKQIHKWLNTYEPYMIERHRVFINLIHTKNKAITEYFTAIQREPKECNNRTKSNKEKRKKTRQTTLQVNTKHNTNKRPRKPKVTGIKTTKTHTQTTLTHYTKTHLLHS